MSRAFGQFAATSQFYLYGRKHFTRTGWEKHQKSYEKPDILAQEMDLTEKVFMITGANSGVGKEVAKYLASKGASVHMVCRSRARAEAALDEIKEATGNSRLFVIEADVGLEADVRRCWAEFAAQGAGSAVPRLDGLVCNAGALMNSQTLTKEGLEVTFASHFLFGTYLLGSLAMPALNATKDSRLVAVSSGGMYNVKFPEWDVAASTSEDLSVKYDGQLAYAYAKRAQVLLCERWAAQHPAVKVVTCHPGWTSTPAVEEAYGDQKKYLEPMRTPWEGAEGIAWLCVAPPSQVESGAFYLDRSPQVKHMAGPFFTEGSFTKNTSEEVDAMMAQAEAWANGRRPQDLARRLELRNSCIEAQKAPLTAMDSSIDLERFMGRWYVVQNIPTYFDRGTINNIEDYTYDAASNTVDVSFTYASQDGKTKSELKQRATVENDAKTRWAINPKLGVYLPLRMAYLVAYCAEDYSSTIVGVPDRSYVWVMTRNPHPPAEEMKALRDRAQALGYDVTQLQVVPQKGDDSTGAVGELSGADSPAVGA